MISWICSCYDPPQEVIQEYSSISKNDTPTLDSANINPGRATWKDTLESIKWEEQHLLPRKQLAALSGKGGYSIKEMKTQSASSSILRKIQKSNYAEILEKCKKKKEKWTDPDFDYSITEVFSSNAKDSSVAEWVRVTDFIPNATFMAYPVKPTQVLQGQLSTCYWLSATAVLAEREYRVKSLFGSLQINPYGIYLCKLFHNGIYREVIVDDFFPVNFNRKPIGVRPYNGTDIWVMVLEKAWAKIYGSYAKVEYGHNIESLWVLTGSPVLGQYNTTLYSKDTTSSRNFFKKLLSHRDRNHIITCSVQTPNANKYGLQEMHSYSVLGIFETSLDDEKIRLVQIRNPLGKTQFNGFEYPKLPYNIKDPFWESISKEEKDRLEYWRIESSTGDGIFYVDWYTFLVFFTQVAIAQVDNNANYIYDTVQMKAGQRKYLELTVTSQVDFHLIIAQANPHTPYSISSNYVDLRVLVATVTHSFDGKTIYKYLLSKSYRNNPISNYLDVPFNALPAGTYIIRIEAIAKAPLLTFGYYSPNDFAIKFIEGIDDDTFVSKTLLSRANSIDPLQYPHKTELVGANGWCCIEYIRQSNIGYVAFHVDAASPNEKYSVAFNESQNVENSCFLYFEGPWQGKSQVSQVVSRGQEVLIPFTYSIWTDDPDINPEAQNKGKLPTPIFSIL